MVPNGFEMIPNGSKWSQMVPPPIPIHGVSKSLQPGDIFFRKNTFLFSMMSIYKKHKRANTISAASAFLQTRYTNDWKFMFLMKTLKTINYKRAVVRQNQRSLLPNPKQLVIVQNVVQVLFKEYVFRISVQVLSKGSF